MDLDNMTKAKIDENYDAIFDSVRETILSAPASISPKMGTLRSLVPLIRELATSQTAIEMLIEIVRNINSEVEKTKESLNGVIKILNSLNNPD